MSEVGNLTIPPTVFEHEDRQELIRFWVAGNAAHISLKFGFLDDQQNEAYMMGQMLADIVGHYTNAVTQGLPDGMSSDELLSTIRSGMADGLGRSGDAQGAAGAPGVH